MGSSKKLREEFPLLFEELDRYGEVIHQWLDKLLPSEQTPPEEIHRAMRYSVFAGGKRLRPVMAVKVFQWADCEGDEIFPPACALELIHTYSLIHDDLPAMDDAEYRRGKLTCHLKFGEAIAILAGDALCALAFEILAQTGNAEIVREVAYAIGTDGLVGGQVLDILGEGKPVEENDVRQIHLRKTAALFVASAKVGAIMANADAKLTEAISNYARDMGLAFQITDDIMDVLGQKEDLGKDAGSDLELDKATYPRAVGLERSLEIARNLVNSAKNYLPQDRDNAFFNQLADFVLRRAEVMMEDR